MWNSDERRYATPRQHLFGLLGLTDDPAAGKGTNSWPVGEGWVTWLRENPAGLASDKDGDVRLAQLVKGAATRARTAWRETNYLLLRRGPYLIGAGLEESVAGEPKTLRGRFVNLFDPD